MRSNLPHENKPIPVAIRCHSKTTAITLIATQILNNPTSISKRQDYCRLGNLEEKIIYANIPLIYTVPSFDTLSLRFYRLTGLSFISRQQQRRKVQVKANSRLRSLDHNPVNFVNSRSKLGWVVRELWTWLWTIWGEYKCSVVFPIDVIWYVFVSVVTVTNIIRTAATVLQMTSRIDGRTANAKRTRKQILLSMCGVADCVRTIFGFWIYHEGMDW